MKWYNRAGLALVLFGVFLCAANGSIVGISYPWALLFMVLIGLILIIVG